MVLGIEQFTKREEAEHDILGEMRNVLAEVNLGQIHAELGHNDEGDRWCAL